MVTTSYIWSCKSGMITRIPPLYFGISSVTVCNQHILPHWTVTHKLQTYPNNKGLACLQTGFLIIPCMSFDVTLPFRTASSTCNTFYRILVSHHPDVIIISSSSPLGTDLGDWCIQPQTEQVLQLICNIKCKPAKHTRSITAIWKRCKLYKKTSKLHQSTPTYCTNTLTSHKYVWLMPILHLKDIKY